MLASKEVRALFAERDKVTGRPSTPDLDDISVPCVNSVKHLINECKAFEQVRRDGT